MADSHYSVPTSQSSINKLISKSKFIATIRRIQSLDEMKFFASEMKNQHQKANHHCWGAIAGAPDDSNLFGFSDDGEPAGTAGKPILHVLQHSGMGQTGLVVSRYFGGTKLGKGGLVRAYSESAKSVIEKASTERFTESIYLYCTFPYDQEKNVRYLLKHYRIKKIRFSYTDRIEAFFSVSADTVCEFETAVISRFGAAVSLKRSTPVPPGGRRKD